MTPTEFLLVRIREWWSDLDWLDRWAFGTLAYFAAMAAVVIAVGFVLSSIFD